MKSVEFLIGHRTVTLILTALTFLATLTNNYILEIYRASNPLSFFTLTFIASQTLFLPSQFDFDAVLSDKMLQGAPQEFLDLTEFPKLYITTQYLHVVVALSLLVLNQWIQI